MRATPKKIYLTSSENRPAVRITIARGGRHQHESPNNLSTYRWRIPSPGWEREAELARLAKGGDKKACAELISIYHKTVIGCAGKHKINYRTRKGRKEYGNGAFDDLVGRGFMALWRAILSYDASRGVPFNAHAWRYISGQVSEEAKDFVKRGLVGESRIDRWLFSHPNSTPGQLVTAFQKKGKDVSYWEASTAIRDFKARHHFKQYRLPEDTGDDPT